MTHTILRSSNNIYHSPKFLSDLTQNVKQYLFTNKAKIKCLKVGTVKPMMLWLETYDSSVLDFHSQASFRTILGFPGASCQSFYFVHWKIIKNKFLGFTLVDFKILRKSNYLGGMFFNSEQLVTTSKLVTKKSKQSKNYQASRVFFGIHH